MSQYILDTDHISLWLQGHPLVQSRVERSIPDVAVTIVTIQELFNGWVVRLNDPKQSNNLVGFIQSYG